TAGSSPDLWTSDGTPIGTFDLGVQVREPTVFNGELYFSDGAQLWKSDGTATGTVQVTNIIVDGRGFVPADLVVANGETYSFARPNDGTQLWKSDGTTAGTVQITDISNNVLNNAAYITAVGSELFFVDGVVDATHSHLDWQVWASDGTSAGTFMVTNFADEVASTNLPNIVGTVGNDLIFNANDGIHGPQVWGSDGTAADTVMLTSVSGGVGAGVSLNLNGQLFFEGHSISPNAYQLWVTDGTVAGTQKLTD